MKNGRKRGFSLVELLIGLVILGFVTTGAVQLMGTGSTLMLRQASSSTRLTTERFTLDSIYNELRKGGIAFIEILKEGNNPLLSETNALDKFIFLRNDGRAVLREWDIGTKSAKDTLLTGADGIRSLNFSMREDPYPDPDNFMLSIDVVAARVNYTDDGAAPRTAHRSVGFFEQTVKNSDSAAVDGVYSGKAIRFMFHEAILTAHNILFVTQTGTGDGSSWVNASNDIQGMIDEVTKGDATTNPNYGKVIWVAHGQFDIPAGKTLQLRKGAKIYGGFVNFYSRTGTTILNGVGKNMRLVECSGDVGVKPENTRLDRFTIINGNGVEGAGMYNKGTSPTVANCTFETNNAGYKGGGMYNENASPTVINCVFSKNIAVGGGTLSNGGGGGMYNNNNSSPWVENCIFSENIMTGSAGTGTDSGGGGMYNYQSSPTVKNCVFYGNSSSHHGGGGMYNKLSPSPFPLVIGCTFLKNFTPTNGGGIVNNGTSATIVNCTFSENSAGTGTGGGLAVSNATASAIVINCTFVGNKVTNAAAGAGVGVNQSATGMVAVNSIFWGNGTTTAGYEISQQNGIIYLRNCVIEPGTRSVFGVAAANSSDITYDDPKIISVDAHGRKTLSSDRVYAYIISSDLTGTAEQRINDALTSSAIDTGREVGSSIIDFKEVTVLSHDQRGVPRWNVPGIGIITTSVDIGAHEYNPDSKDIYPKFPRGTPFYP